MKLCACVPQPYHGFSDCTITVVLLVGVVTDQTWSPFLILRSGGGRRFPRSRDTHCGINNYLLSFSCRVHFNMPRVVFKITTIRTDFDIQKKTMKKPNLSVFACCLLLRGNLCRFTMRLCQLNQTLDEDKWGQKLYTCTDMKKTPRLAHRRAH